MILLDTDVCIELLRGNYVIMEKCKKYDDEIAVSFMTAAELFYGAELSGQRDKNMLLVESFLLTVEVIHSDLEILKKFGELKGRLSQQKLLVADADTFIAATCFIKCDKLITGNTRHFARFDGLKLENWIK